MILGGGEQRRTGSAAIQLSTWSLRDQRGKVWSLLEQNPALREVPLAVAVLVENWVAS